MQDIWCYGKCFLDSTLAAKNIVYKKVVGMTPRTGANISFSMTKNLMEITFMDIRWNNMYFSRVVFYFKGTLVHKKSTIHRQIKY